MRKVWALVLSMAFLGGAAFAQGINDDLKNPNKGKNPTEKPSDALKKFKKQGNAGTGFVQQSFMTDLEKSLQEKTGEKKGSQLYENFKKSDADADEMVDVMNGKASKRKVKKLFGCGDKTAKQVGEALDDAVDQKNKKMFFGMIIIIIVGDMGMDPSGDFAQQIAGARDEISKEDFEKLLKKNSSKNFMGKCFGLENKADQTLMSDACKSLFSSPMANHPMAESLGLGQQGQFDPKDFMKLGAGMPGSGGAFEDGMAGALPFAGDLPPMPFLGGNMGGFFESCQEGPGDEAPTEGATGETAKSDG